VAENLSVVVTDLAVARRMNALAVAPVAKAIAVELAALIADDVSGRCVDLRQDASHGLLHGLGRGSLHKDLDAHAPARVVIHDRQRIPGPRPALRQGEGQEGKGQAGEHGDDGHVDVPCVVGAARDDFALLCCWRRRGRNCRFGWSFCNRLFGIWRQRTVVLLRDTADGAGMQPDASLKKKRGDLAFAEHGTFDPE